LRADVASAIPCALVVLTLVACSSPVPSPSAAITASETPSATEQASLLPRAQCDPAPRWTTTDKKGNEIPVEPLRCRAAVRAAVAALPTTHPGVRAIEFHYGGYCPPGYYCSLPVPTQGYVVFRMVEPAADLWVQVAGTWTARVTEGPAHFPPAQ
jgi:hypothetical protein